MPYEHSKVLGVGISSRALFDLEKENELFDTQGLKAYTAYQIDLWSKIQSLRNCAEDGDE